MPAEPWNVGDRLVHPYDPELGVGLIRAIDGRHLHVFFPATERELVLTRDAPIVRHVLVVGQSARLIETGEKVTVAELEGPRVRLTSGPWVDATSLWPLGLARSPIDLVATGRVGSVDAFVNRYEGLRLAELREAGGLGSFLGGRIELFPHQLHTALQAVQSDSVRWLLADEVGLGKTIEACLILSALVRTGRSARTIVVAPETLTVQWLGELYTKFHQVFILFDDDRLESIAGEFGDDFNPFEAHRNVLVSFERLAASPELLRLALECDPDLLVIDESHRLAVGGLAARFATLVAAARHVLLLTATPLASDLEGFHALLAMLHPREIGTYAEFARAIEQGTASLRCTSAVRRSDLGGFPPRVPVPIDLPALTGDPRTDPRTRWLAEHVPEWRARGEKVLVFVAELEELEALRAELERITETRVTVFHEGLDLAERDIRLVRFRGENAPLLLCSEAGGEGRNFQFCQRMVHHDLPADPIRLEQRIGRLDRIGRDRPVEIVYFRPANAKVDVARLYERLDLFTTPSAGIDAALGGVQEAIETAEASGRPLHFEAIVQSVIQARSSAARSAPRVLYPDAYDPSKAQAVLARIPPDLEKRTERYCTEAARQLGLKVVQRPGAARYYIELPAPVGRAADVGDEHQNELLNADWDSLLTRVDSLPGVSVTSLPGYGNEVRFLGTFDRGEALQNQGLAFFASGQMLVEGLMLELDDSPRGRAARLEIEGNGLTGTGLLCLYKQGARWTARIVDSTGRLRPEWVSRILDALPRARQWPVADARSANAEAVAERIRKLATLASHGGDTPGPVWAAALFRFR